MVDLIMFVSFQVSRGGLMYADLGPYVQAPVQPPSIGYDVQYSLLLHNQGEQVALDQAGMASLVSTFLWPSGTMAGINIHMVLAV